MTFHSQQVVYDIPKEWKQKGTLGRKGLMQSSILSSILMQSFTEQLIYFINGAFYFSLHLHESNAHTVIFLSVFSVDWTCRRSRSQMFFKIDVLKNFANYTGKHPCWSLFNKVEGLKACNFIIKKRLQHRCFPVKFVKFVKTLFFIEHLRWLLLDLQILFFFSKEIDV